MSKCYDLKQFDYYARKAYEAGGRLVDTNVIDWDCSNGCQSPSHFTMTFRERRSERDTNGYIGRYVDWSNTRQCPEHIPNMFDNTPKVGGIVKWIDIHVPCRKCEVCLKKRANLWYFRAKTEIQMSVRTWLLTLTLSPDWHYYCECQAVKKYGYWSNTELGRLEQRHNIISAEITRYLKRVRKEAGVTLRFLLVLECHKSGLPHYHLLIHEPCIDECVRKRTLQSQWKWGFSDARLVDTCHAGAYVAKYLNKSILARVRASIDYGDPLRSLRSVNIEKRSLLAFPRVSPVLQSPIEGCDCPF